MNRNMAGLSLLISVALALVLSSALLAAALGVGFTAGNLKFAKTMAPADQAYLGLKNPGAFALISRRIMCWWKSSMPTAPIAWIRLRP